MSHERFTPARRRFDQLHARAQQLLRTGALPRCSPKKTFAGKGSEFKCALCDVPVYELEIEYTLEFDRPIEHSGTNVIRFHLECHLIWDYERCRVSV